MKTRNKRRQSRHSDVLLASQRNHPVSHLSFSFSPVHHSCRGVTWTDSFRGGWRGDMTRARATADRSMRSSPPPPPPRNGANETELCSRRHNAKPLTYALPLLPTSHVGWGRQWTGASREGRFRLKKIRIKEPQRQPAPCNHRNHRNQVIRDLLGWRGGPPSTT